MVRTGDASSLQSFDGDRVSLMAHQVPDHRDKEDLLRDTWRTASTLLHDRSIGDENALEYAALTVAAGILYALPFIEGNCRTSRTLSYAIATGVEDEQVLGDMVSDTMQHSWHVTPNMNLALPMYWPTGGEQPKNIDWEFQLAGEGEDALGGAIVNSFYSDWIVRKFLVDADEHTKTIVETCATRSEDGQLESIDGDKLLKALMADQDRGIDYAHQLLAIERGIRSNNVKRFLGALLLKEPGPIKTLKSYQLDPGPNGKESDHERAAKLNEVVQERGTDGKLLPRDELVALHRGYSKARKPKHTQPV
jgi:hypothetical protein